MRAQGIEYVRVNWKQGKQIPKRVMQSFYVIENKPFSISLGLHTSRGPPYFYPLFSPFISLKPRYMWHVSRDMGSTILAIFKSTLWHFGNLLVKNIQNDFEIFLIICGPTTDVHHGLYTGCHWGVKRFQDLRSDPVWDLLGNQSPACNRHSPCAIFLWP